MKDFNFPEKSIAFFHLPKGGAKCNWGVQMEGMLQTSLMGSRAKAP